jgi:hypothetical protein
MNKNFICDFNALAAGHMGCRASRREIQNGAGGGEIALPPGLR